MDSDKVIIHFDAEGVSSDNFEDVKAPFKQGLSAAINVPISQIKLTLHISRMRRLLTMSSITAEINTDDANALLNEINGISN